MPWSELNKTPYFGHTYIYIPVDSICHRWDFHWRAVEEDNIYTFRNVWTTDVYHILYTAPKTVATTVAAQMAMFESKPVSYTSKDLRQNKALIEKLSAFCRFNEQPQMINKCLLVEEKWVISRAEASVKTEKLQKHKYSQFVFIKLIYACVMKRSWEEEQMQFHSLSSQKTCFTIECLSCSSQHVQLVNADSGVATWHDWNTDCCWDN